MKLNRGSLIGVGLVSFFIIIAVLSPLIAPHAYDQIFEGALKLPAFWQEGGSRAFLLGTDDLGRDLLSRLIYGAPVSLGIGFAVVIFATIIGTFLGLLAGTLRGWVDVVLSRLMDIILALPSMLMAIVVIAILGPSVKNTVLAVGIVSIPQIFRVIRATALVEMSKNYVVAIQTFGGSWWRVAIRNVLPNCVAPLIVQATLGLSDAILNAAALGFLGLGAQPPLPEWGTMLSDARSFIESSPWMVTLPGLCILLVVIGFNLLGDALRDHLDPRLKR
ncbi:MAG: ABC transporter permease subunit [Bdellovibrionota bacterium]